MKTIAILATILVAAAAAPMAGASPFPSVTILAPTEGGVAGWGDDIVAEYRGANLFSAVLEVEVMVDGLYAFTEHVAIDAATSDTARFEIFMNASREFGVGGHSLQLRVQNALAGPSAYSQVVGFYALDAPLPRVEVDAVAFARGTLVVDAYIRTFDDADSNVTLTVGDARLSRVVSDGPEVLALDLSDLAPGPYEATLNVTDASGRTRLVAIPFVAEEETILFADRLYTGAGLFSIFVPAGTQARVYACYAGGACTDLQAEGLIMTPSCHATIERAPACTDGARPYDTYWSVEYALASDADILVTAVG